LVGLILSQLLPSFLGSSYDSIAQIVRVLTMVGLSFIMIHVGFEFNVDKSNLKSYGWDYFVAFTAAFFPWILVTGYFIFVMLPPEFWSNFDAWKETLLAGRFAAPTSAGVLFSMLAAAGLGATWLFKKARILAIFDDLDTVLLMIPLKILMVGLAWQMGVIVFVMVFLLSFSYIWLHKIRIPVNWFWVLIYAAGIAIGSEVLYKFSKIVDPSVPIHIEVLLPAFVLGCIAKPPKLTKKISNQELESAFHKILDKPREKLVATIVSAVFMILVGLSMPTIFKGADSQHPQPSNEILHSAAPDSSVDDPTIHGGKANDKYDKTVTGKQPSMSWGLILLHVLLVTIISNIGKMFPAFCYRKEAHWRERLAVAIGMWPRGEVGAGILVLSISYGIGGPIVTVAMLSLSLNLILTGVFIIFVKRLLSKVPNKMEMNTST